MEQIYYQDIDDATSTGNFDRIITKVNRGVSRDDMVLIISELADKLDRSYVLRLEGELADIQSKAYDDVGTLVHCRTQKLEEMPEDTVLTKADIIRIMDNLEDTIEQMGYDSEEC